MVSYKSIFNFLFSNMGSHFFFMKERVKPGKRRRVVISIAKEELHLSYGLLGNFQILTKEELHLYINNKAITPKSSCLGILKSNYNFEMLI
jgi:hypothetical protein